MLSKDLVKPGLNETLVNLNKFEKMQCANQIKTKAAWILDKLDFVTARTMEKSGISLIDRIHTYISMFSNN